MIKYTEVSTEELKKRLKESDRLEQLCSFNTSSERRRLEMQSCFMKAELIRRGEFCNCYPEHKSGMAIPTKDDLITCVKCGKLLNFTN